MKLFRTTKADVDWQKISDFGSVWERYRSYKCEVLGVPGTVTHASKGLTATSMDQNRMYRYHPGATY
jgi:hypothetical protein